MARIGRWRTGPTILVDFRLYLELGSLVKPNRLPAQNFLYCSGNVNGVSLEEDLTAAVARTIVSDHTPLFEDDKTETFEMLVSGLSSFSRLIYTIQLTASVTVVNRIDDVRALLDFQRLQRFYNTFNILPALIGGLAIATLTLNEFHPCTTSMARSAICAVISTILSTMLLFRFESHETTTRKRIWQSPRLRLFFLVGLSLSSFSG